MKLSRCLSGLLAALLALPLPAFAQTEQPLIRLDAAQDSKAPSETPQAAAESPSAPSAGVVPRILLPAPAPLAPATADPQRSPVIPERDRGDQAIPARAQEWLLPLTPTIRLPDQVQIGPSQPSPGILRLTGEIVNVDFLLEMPQHAALPNELVLTLRSTVNVLPDVSAMTVTINDGTPVVMPLDHLAGFETVAIPGRGLIKGTNRVRLDLRQPHRIYCGPAASFSVWTELDLRQSGARLHASVLAPDAAGFAAAMRAQAATSQPLPVLVAEDEDPLLLRQLAEMLGRVSDGQVPIEFRSFYALGPSAPLSIALIASHRSHAELREGAGGGLVLQVEHASGRLPALADLLPRLPPPAHPVPTLTPGVATALAELGQADIIGRTRYFRHEVPFDLPMEWMLLSNQKARLQLRYGFADALPQGSKLLVKINGETVRLLPLDRDGGEMMEPLDIIFGANLLHGGRNELMFEMMVPGNPPDAICLPRQADMLVVTSDSTLLVPPGPSMAFAGLAMPLATLGPAGVRVPEGVRHRDTLGRMVAQFVALLGPSTGGTDDSVRLNVVGVGDVSVMPLEHLGIPVRGLQEALVDRGAQSALDVTAARARADAPAVRYQLTEEKPAPAEPAPGADAGFGQSFFDGPRDWLETKLKGVRSAAFIGSDASLPAWLETREGRALLLRPNPDEPSDLWLVLGPQVRTEEALKGLVQLRDSGLARGEAALLAADGSWQVWSPVRPPMLGEPVRLSNLRAVLGNYASWSPLLFTIATLGLAALSAIPALLFALLTRRRSQL